MQSSMQNFVINSPLDMHLHLRDGDMVITQGAGNIGALARSLAANSQLGGKSED